jgi:hypothetical protein
MGRISEAWPALALPAMVLFRQFSASSAFDPVSPYI